MYKKKKLRKAKSLDQTLYGKKMIKQFFGKNCLAGK